MLLSTQSRIESLLTTIDQLGMVTIRQLRQKHDLKSYRNACRVVKQLEPYVHTTFFNKEKVLYLNKNGVDLIGSTRDIKRNPAFIKHSLLVNEVYFHFNCPLDWKREHIFELESIKQGIIFSGLNLTYKKVIADAKFERNGYMHLIEIDNARKMIENHKKIDSYVEVMKQINHTIPVLYVFTISKDRKRKFESWIKQNNLRAHVHTFDEINKSHKFNSK
ncbi:replication-relaxation family protein [Bacillus sp. Gen3]|nr:replication-relaxation family protein [Bacillus sp. Gen3]